MLEITSSPRMTIERRDDPRSGFTIIEVVLVLAIAGLIFLMVFIALPALQRSQRDTQRRDDLARLATAITQYQTNNNNRLPNYAQDPLDVTCNSDGCDDTFIDRYLGGTEEFSDPLTTVGYSITFQSLSGTGSTGDAVNTLSDDDVDDGTNNGYRIMVYTHAACDGEQAAYSSSQLDYAIVYNLEGSGTACID